VIRGGCNKSLELIKNLKAEVDKNDKDTLSIGLIRKADEIEKPARSAKEKTGCEIVRQAAGAPFCARWSPINGPRSVL
jgi:hypothetical protein